MSGKVVLLGLPIGNKEDLTERVRKSLETGLNFFVEDTRSFKNLLSSLALSYEDKKILSFHDQSGRNRFRVLDEWIEQGKTVYFASEAGSTVISDPGYDLLKYCREKHIAWDSYPGVSAVTTALELSGLASVPFTFLGFLPRKKGDQENLFSSMKETGGTFVAFESPQRVEDSLAVAQEVIPHFQLSLCREMTKMFQQVLRPQELSLLKLSELEKRGEYTLVFAAPKEGKTNLHKIRKAAQDVLDSGGKNKAVSKLLGAILEEDSKKIYEKLFKN